MGTAIHSIPDYQEKIRQLFQRHLSIDSKKELALHLYTTSHFEQTSLNRFLRLITIVEILSIRQKVADEVMAVISEFKTAVAASTLNEDGKEKLVDRLNELETESISSACRALVQKHGGDDAYFSKCYKARSELVHTGRTKLPHANDPTRLDELVSRVLIAEICGNCGITAAPA